MPEPPTLDDEITLAMRALERAGPSSPDDALSRIERLVKRADDRGFTDGARDLLTCDAADLRALGYFLFGVFLRFGPAALPPLLDVWHRALTTAWPRAKPEADRDRVATDALRWMLRTLVQRIDFHTQMHDATWAAWRADGFYGAEALAASARVRVAMSEALEEPSRAVELLTELDARVREHFSRRRPTTLPPAPTDGADGMPSDGIAADGMPSDDIAPGATHPSAADPAAPRPTAPDPRPAPPSGGTVTLTVSPALAALLRNIQAFERLVEAGDLARAAIVSEGVDAALDAFDPRRYLPDLLADHFRRVAAIADEMQARDAAQSPARRAALGQLYRTDLDLFLE